MHEVSHVFMLSEPAITGISIKQNKINRRIKRTQVLTDRSYFNRGQFSEGKIFQNVTHRSSMAARHYCNDGRTKGHGKQHINSFIFNAQCVVGIYLCCNIFRL